MSEPDHTKEANDSREKRRSAATPAASDFKEIVASPEVQEIVDWREMLVEEISKSTAIKATLMDPQDLPAPGETTAPLGVMAGAIYTLDEISIKQYSNSGNPNWRKFAFGDWKVVEQPFIDVEVLSADQKAIPPPEDK